jgi:hypothetical protein
VGTLRVIIAGSRTVSPSVDEITAAIPNVPTPRSCFGTARAAAAQTWFAGWSRAISSSQ